MFARGLTRARRVGIGKIAVWSREQPALLRPYGGNRLVLHTLYWPHEHGAPPEHGPAAQPTEQELGMADVLIGALSLAEPPEQQDQYTEALDRLVEAKVADKALEPPAEPAPTVDLMAALEASIRAARGQHPAS